MAQRNPAPVLSGFTYIDWLGGGGFADVFRYRQEGLGREVAVKVLHRGVGPKALEAFNNESNLMAKLSNHPNIVSIYQAGVAEDGRPFLVMEMCPSPHLGERVSKRLYGPAKAMEVGIQIAGAVETAHRLGILHRDIKPANILFTDFDRPALTDFGISVSTDKTVKANTAMSPLWAPPEQFGNMSVGVGPWSDVYSLAATIWASLTGHSPMFISGQPNDIMTLSSRARTMSAPRIGRAEVPEQLERVLAVALAKNPYQRFQSALEFARALQGVQASVHQNVTPVDVLSDEPQLAVRHSELQGEGTRVSGFMVIDPDDVEASGRDGEPNGEVTLPSLKRQAPIQHEMTLPPVEKKKFSSGLFFSIVLGIALISGLVLYAVATMGSRATVPSPTVTSSPTTKGDDPVIAAVPPVKNLTAVAVGGEVNFSWENPDPQPGDTYTYQVIDLSGSSVKDFTPEPKVSVAASSSGKTCLEVSLVRANGRISEPIRKCTE